MDLETPESEMYPETLDSEINSETSDNDQKERPALNDSRAGLSYRQTSKQYSDFVTKCAALPDYHHLGVINHILQLPHLEPRLLEKPLDPPSPYFATLLDLQGDGKTQTTHLKEPNQLTQRAENGVNHILFLKGQPCPHWLSHVGAMYNMHPEFFSRHLQEVCKLRYEDPVHFHHPSFISTWKTVIHFRYVSMGVIPPGFVSHLEGLSRARRRYQFRQSEYLIDLKKKILRAETPAESMVRDYHLLDYRAFAIEQQASISLQKMEQGWKIVAWLDTGIPMKNEGRGPWIEQLAAWNYRSENKLKPFEPWKISQPLEWLRTFAPGDLKPQNWWQKPMEPASLLHLDYGSKLDKKLMEQDPFYSLHELFMAFAHSEALFLSRVEDNIDRVLSPVTAFANRGSFGKMNTDTIIYLQTVLDAHTETLSGNVKFFKSRHDLGWPRPSDSKAAEKAAFEAQILIRDYEGLLEKAESLSRKCRERVQTIMGRLGIEESTRGIEQGEVVTKLTRLAFVFIPLSFVSSFFGMNLSPLVEPAVLNIWVFFAVSITLLVLIYTFMHFEMATIKSLRRQFRVHARDHGRWFAFKHAWGRLRGRYVQL